MQGGKGLEVQRSSSPSPAPEQVFMESVVAWVKRVDEAMVMVDRGGRCSGLG